MSYLLQYKYSITFTGSGLRIFGDLSNATTGNRLSFVTTASNSASFLQVLPSGSATQAGLVASAINDVANASVGILQAIGGGDVRVLSSRNGGGSFLPLGFYTSDVLRLTIDASGNYAVAGTGVRFRADLDNATLTNRFSFQTSTTDANTFLSVLPNGTGTNAGINFSNNSSPTNASLASVRINATELRIMATRDGSGTFLPMLFYTSDVVFLTAETTGVCKFAKSTSGPVVTVTSDTTLTVNNQFVRVDATSVNIVITLAAANAWGAGNASRITIKRIDSSANTVTVQRGGSDTIDGATSTTHSALQSKDYFPDGVSAWAIA